MVLLEIFICKILKLYLSVWYSSKISKDPSFCLDSIFLSDSKKLLICVIAFS